MSLVMILHFTSSCALYPNDTQGWCGLRIWWIFFLPNNLMTLCLCIWDEFMFSLMIIVNYSLSLLQLQPRLRRS